MKRHIFGVAVVFMFLLTLFIWGKGSGFIQNCAAVVGELTMTEEETDSPEAPAETISGDRSSETEMVSADNGISEEKSDGEPEDNTVAEGKSVSDEKGEGESIAEYGADDSSSATAGQIALTFDDGPHAIYTPLLLDGLKERGVKATFFLMGQNIEGNEDIVKRMSEEGHLIGNHTYSHVQLTAVSEAEALAEIEKDSRLIESIAGATVAWIRPPYGSVTQSLAEKMNLRIVLWDIDPRDWESQNASLVVKHILSHIGDGEIILLHDIFRSSVEAALMVIDELTAHGYEFVRVDELGMYE